MPRLKPFPLKFRGDDMRKSWADRGDVEVIALLAWAEIHKPIVAVDEAAHAARLTGYPEQNNARAVQGQNWYLVYHTLVIFSRIADIH